jgi:uncharacterized protein YfaT (DUF1175 family)
MESIRFSHAVSHDDGHVDFATGRDGLRLAAPSSRWTSFEGSEVVNFAAGRDGLRLLGAGRALKGQGSSTSRRAATGLRLAAPSWRWTSFEGSGVVDFAAGRDGLRLAARSGSGRR